MTLVPMITAGAVAFWVCAPLMVLGALGMVLLRKPVHSAISLALVMVCLAVQYAALNAPFLFVVQIIVYTGAIMMLFLFVLMLVGVDSADSIVETIQHHRVPAILAALGFGMLLVFGVGNAVVDGEVVGLDAATASAGGNVQAIAELLFTRWVFAFEATAALLITAAVGAMVLAHGERLHSKIGQREAAELRMRRFSESGEHPGPLPSSGVFARHNAIHTPALLPDGSVAPQSVSRTLAERGALYEAGELKVPTRATFKAIQAVKDDIDEGGQL